MPGYCEPPGWLRYQCEQQEARSALFLTKAELLCLDGTAIEVWQGSSSQAYMWSARKRLDMSCRAFRGLQEGISVAEARKGAGAGRAPRRR